MPKILVMADAADGHSSAILLSERVAPELRESGHYAAQLVERVRWALQDATHLDVTGAKRRRAAEKAAQRSSGGVKR